MRLNFKLTGDACEWANELAQEINLANCAQSIGMAMHCSLPVINDKLELDEAPGSSFEILKNLISTKAVKNLLKELGLWNDESPVEIYLDNSDNCASIYLLAYNDGVFSEEDVHLIEKAGIEMDELYNAHVSVIVKFKDFQPAKPEAFLIKIPSTYPGYAEGIFVKHIPSWLTVIYRDGAIQISYTYGCGMNYGG